MTTKPEVFTDTAGRSLARADVELLAKRNKAASSDAGSIGNDYELLEWATDANGEFAVPQVEHYSLAFLPADVRGVRREDL